MATLQQIEKAKLLIGEINEPDIMDDVRIAGLIDMFVPTHSNAAEVRTAIECLSILAQFQSGMYPEQSNRYAMRADFLKKNWTSVPAVEVESSLGYVLTLVADVATASDWNTTATAVMGGQYQIPAFSGDTRYVYFASRAAPTSITTDAFSNNMIGAFTILDNQIDINGITYYQTRSNQKWNGEHVSGTKWFVR